VLLPIVFPTSAAETTSVWQGVYTKDQYHTHYHNLSSRNMAICEGLLIAATSDANLIALDAKSGKLV
jgi:glucose dehydrogenase